MGRDEEVFLTVETLLSRIETMPVESSALETALPWNVRETLLDVGHTAALHTRRSETAMALNAEILKARVARSADELDLARTRFNDNGPLMALDRFGKKPEPLF